MVRQWLSGGSLKDFLREDFGRAPRMGLGTAWGAAPLLDWGVVAGLLRLGHRPRVGGRGTRWRGPAPATMVELHRHMRAGRALDFPLAHRGDELLRRLAETVRGDLAGARVGVDVAVQPPGRGWGLRMTPLDAFMVQCAGSRTVYFRESLRGTPRAWRLAPGDWLYLPAGWPYLAVADGDSLSLSVCASYSPAARRSARETKVKPRERTASTRDSSRSMPPSVAAS